MFFQSELISMLSAPSSIMFFKILVFMISCIVLENNGISLDYFYGTALRTNEKTYCHSNIEKIQCQFNCGETPGVCFKSNCFCLLNMTVLPNIPEISRIEKISYKVKTDKRDDIDENNENVNYLDESLLYPPVLRHHIAHFCPNLDIARKCIRKCMEFGKPAFCGKDHVCYCGHKYTEHDNNTQANAKEMAKGFRDLYLKYFGQKDQGSVESLEQ